MPKDRFGNELRPCAVCGGMFHPLVWDGEKSICFSCEEKQRDFERGYAYGPHCWTKVPLEEKYPELRKGGEG